MTGGGRGTRSAAADWRWRRRQRIGDACAIPLGMERSVENAAPPPSYHIP
ncbi:MAG: hypothetical protein LBB79_00670 [Prevotellaceae bacterium]|nr:hypothetical protein [Prevotellaceae bacterium]